MKISGYTSLTGVIATPIRHSLSPAIHNTAFDKLGLDYVYLAFEVSDEQFAGAVTSIRALGMRGVNISMPYKQKIIPYLDKLSPAAKLVKAVNTVVNDNGLLTGHITDGTGFMRSLTEENHDVIGKKIVVAGAGGAAMAICVQAALDGVKELSLFNRTKEKSEHIVNLINEKTNCKAKSFSMHDNENLRKELADSVIYINTTSVGMKPCENENLIKEAYTLHPGLIVADIIYNPRKTKLLEMAETRGCKTVNGLGMILYQGAEAFKLWTGCEMPVDYVKEMVFK